MSATQSTPPNLQHISAERLLVGDLIILFRLGARAVGKAAGVAAEDSTLLMLIVLGLVGRDVRRASRAPRAEVRKVRASPHFTGDAVMATAAVRETVDSIAGHPSRDTQFAVALIAAAVAAHALRPAVVGSLRAMRAIGPKVISDAFKFRSWFEARGDAITAASREVVEAARHLADDSPGSGESDAATAEPTSRRGAQDEELARLSDLYRSGALSEEEFSAARSRLLG